MRGKCAPETRRKQLKRGQGYLTNFQRKLLCEHHARHHGQISQKDLAEWAQKEFQLRKKPAQSTISGILRRRHEFMNMSLLDLGVRKRRVVNWPLLDMHLANWVIQCAHRGIQVQGDITKQKAREFATMLGIPEQDQPEFSNGWLHSFQTRHNFSFRRFNAQSSKESPDVPPPSLYTPYFLAQNKERRGQANQVVHISSADDLKTQVTKYASRDVFCMTETAILYNRPPSNVVKASLINENDAKLVEKRVVALFTMNGDGSSTIPPLFISHLQYPQCFQGKSAAEHGFQYFANVRAALTGIIFSRWLHHLDYAMSLENRQILLVLDEAPSHTVAHLELTNVTVAVLSPSVHSLNPVATTLVRAFKARYRRYQLRSVLQVVNGPKTVADFRSNVLECMQWAVNAWREIPKRTITASWHIVGMAPPADGFLKDVKDENDVTNQLLMLMQELEPYQASELDAYLDDDTHCRNSVHAEYVEVPTQSEDVLDEPEEAMPKKSLHALLETPDLRPTEPLGFDLKEVERVAEALPETSMGIDNWTYVPNNDALTAFISF